MIVFYIVAASTVFVMGGSTYLALNMAKKEGLNNSLLDQSTFLESMVVTDSSQSTQSQSTQSTQSGGGPTPGTSIEAFVPMIPKLYRAVTFDRHGVINPQYEMLWALVVRLTVSDVVFFAYVADTVLSLTTGVARFSRDDTLEDRRRRACAMMIPWYAAAYAFQKV